jgi:hypothetical protein
MTPEIVRSVVKRHMRSTDSFVSPEAGARCPVEVELVGDEALVGWYTNPPEEEPATLVFTTMAIHVVVPGEKRRLAIDDFTSCLQPDSKEVPKGLCVLVGECEHFLPAAGSHGKDGHFKDAYNLFAVIRGLLPADRT